MLTLIIVILLALVLLAYAAVPLLFPGQVEALPSLNDPLLLDLEEERDALFRAIRELELREDLPAERREQLRARYEAKAAKVLRALDERQAALNGQTQAVKRQPSRHIPYGVLGLLGLMVATGIVMSAYVLPRVGSASITASFDGDIEAARELQKLQRAADREPNQETLLALADAYWQLEEADQAEATYLRMVNELGAVSAVPYYRLALLKLQEDVGAALPLLEQARAIEPENLNVLFALGEVYFSQAQPDNAVAAFEAFLATPEGANDLEVQARLETIRSVAPLLNRATETPSEDSLSALADAYWTLEERERAADIYVNILANFNPHNAAALSRVGQVLFFGGQTEQAVELLEQARQVAPDDLTTLLFLGNAYFTLQNYETAIGVWETYVTAAGGEAQAGRVPGLIENARAQLATAESTAETTGATTAESPAAGTASTTLVQTSGEQLYASNCAACHGSNAQGGTGPRLVGNTRAADRGNVRNIVEYGRGAMPGFGTMLSDEELEHLVTYITEVIATEQTSEVAND